MPVSIGIDGFQGPGIVQGEKATTSKKFAYQGGFPGLPRTDQVDHARLFKRAFENGHEMSGEEVVGHAERAVDLVASPNCYYESHENTITALTKLLVRGACALPFGLCRPVQAVFLLSVDGADKNK